MGDEQKPEEPSPSDEGREKLLSELSASLGETLIESHLRAHEDLWLRVRVENWSDAVRTARAAGFLYFGFLSAIDWDIAPEGRYEDTEFDEGLTEEDEQPVELDASSGYAGGDSRFQLLAQLYSLERQLGLLLKADVGDDMTVDTIRDIFPGADWHERETHEMFGITFQGHPTLPPLYLPTEFEGMACEPRHGRQVAERCGRLTYLPS